MSEDKKQKPKPKLDPAWRVRRAVVLFTIGFCCGIIIYITGWGANNRLMESIATGAQFLLGAVVTGYTGLAVWDDKNKKGKRK